MSHAMVVCKQLASSPAPSNVDLKDPTEWTLARVVVPNVIGNVCETSDGKAIAAYPTDIGIHIVIAPNISGVLDGTVPFDLNASYVVRPVSAGSILDCSLTLIEGKLNLVICDQTTTPRIAELWRDTDGKGLTFSKVSTIMSDSHTREIGTPNNAYTVSCIAVLGNGNWVVCLPWYITWHDSVMAFYSTDKGLSWHQGVGVYTYYNAAFCSKTLCPINTDEFIAVLVGSSAAQALFHWSASGASVQAYTMDYAAWAGAMAIIGSNSKTGYLAFLSPDTWCAMLYKLKSDVPISAGAFINLANFDLIASISSNISASYVGFIFTEHAVLIEFNQNGIICLGTEAIKNDPGWGRVS